MVQKLKAHEKWKIRTNEKIKTAVTKRTRNRNKIVRIDMKSIHDNIVLMSYEIRIYHTLFCYFVPSYLLYVFIYGRSKQITVINRYGKLQCPNSLGCVRYSGNISKCFQDDKKKQSYFRTVLFQIHLNL